MTDKRSIKVLPVGGTSFDVSLEGGGSFRVKAKAVSLDCAEALEVEPRQRWVGVSMALRHRDERKHLFRVRLGDWIFVSIACNGHEATFWPRFEGRDAYQAMVTRYGEILFDEPRSGEMTVPDFERGFTGAEERLTVSLSSEGEAWTIEVAHEEYFVKLTAPRTVPVAVELPALELETEGLDELVVEGLGLRTAAA